FGAISYIGVREAALKTGRERLQTLSLQLSTMLTSSARNLITSAYAQGNKPSVTAYLLSGKKDSIQEVNKLFIDLLKDSTCMQVDLIGPNHDVVLRLPKKTPISVPLDSLLRNENKKIDSGYVGKIYAFGDSVYYPVIANIEKNERHVGYLIRWRIIQAKSGSLDQLSRLMGTDARLYIGSIDGSLWTDMIKTIPPPPSAKGFVEYDRAGKTWFASINSIPNTKWLISVEFPKNKILQTAQTFLYWLVMAGSIFLVIGIFFAWLMSRNISTPLVQLTNATSEIASGNFSSKIFVNRLDELGKLARSFNSMSVQLQNSRKELEQKAENYQLLFEKNPMPMWIMSKNNFNILDVNNAAVEHYGYSKKEFLQLNSLDLRPKEDIQEFLESVATASKGVNKHEIWRHKKKDGTIIMADVISNDIEYKDQQARLVLSNDVTEKLRVEAELVEHRLLQQEIIAETAIQAQEQERDELGRELHDNINQILASTKLYLEIACNGDTELFTQALSKGYENVNLAIAEIRRLSKQLVPPVLEDMLTNVLNEMTDEIHATTNVNFESDLTAFDEKKLNEDIKLMIYRIVQEQINNIVKHARASHVNINIANDAHRISLLIADNGVGFDTKQKRKGIGLRNIENRVKFYKGSATIRSEEGKGCILEVYIPMKNITAVLQ
ncbi:MAG TPA: PAS domain S-box protein, partial [Flavisolibacter sp.]|nr:PAS domain S-box protein [Flavisolibacter sp.]